VVVKRARYLVHMSVGAGVSVAHLVSSASPVDFRSTLAVADLDTRSQRHVPRIAATNPTFRSLTRDYGKRVRETALYRRALAKPDTVPFSRLAALVAG